MDGLKRFGIRLPLRQHGLSSPLTLDWQAQSPIVSVSGAGNDSGSLFTGILLLRVEGSPIEISGIRAALDLNVCQKRPAQRRCMQCKRQHTELQDWNFVPKQRILQPGHYEFPISTRISSHSPASIKVPALSVSYHFRAEVEFSRAYKSSAERKRATLERDIIVKRPLHIQDGPCYWVCPFPDAGLDVSSSFNTAFSVSKSNQVVLKLSGLSSDGENAQNIRFWKLWKGSWRLEETIQTRASPCEQHACGLSTEEARGLTHEQVRILGEQSIYSGWECAGDGQDTEVRFQVQVKKRKRKRYNYARDTEMVDGTKISHALMVELVLLKEYAAPDKLNATYRTGEGRILRLRYALTLAEDQEQIVEAEKSPLPYDDGSWSSPPSYSEEDLLQATQAENHELV